MDLQNLINVFIPNGLQSLIIGTVVGAVFSVADAFLQKKNARIDAFYPLVAGFTAFSAYALITLPISEFLSEETTSANVLCGSIAAAVFVFIKNLKNGKSDNADALKALLSCYTDEKKAKNLSKKTAEILAENLTEKELTEKIFSLLKEEGINPSFAKSLAEKLIAEKTAKTKDDGKDKL